MLPLVLGSPGCGDNVQLRFTEHFDWEEFERLALVSGAAQLSATAQEFVPLSAAPSGVSAELACWTEPLLDSDWDALWPAWTQLAPLSQRLAAMEAFVHAAIPEMQK